ncbi:uncharacterized protein LOC129921848 [Biomphalaria glabrata]|uniref:Uncharacterized protein LOC129921848 n=1 Tax=Biomphalaria glabrata TaxID=6526 RepID=A0A9W2YE38_BIOGL|nr:uncharacterized protein LOC129921848 [Biomphalaria glabrata]XP_055860993.1 uncharacterized protein LOC129921848 [Biomphalaria glabrata]
MCRVSVIMFLTSLCLGIMTWLTKATLGETCLTLCWSQERCDLRMTVLNMSCQSATAATAMNISCDSIMNISCYCLVFNGINNRSCQNVTQLISKGEDTIHCCQSEPLNVTSHCTDSFADKDYCLMFIDTNNRSCQNFTLSISEGNDTVQCCQSEPHNITTHCIVNFADNEKATLNENTKSVMQQIILGSVIGGCLLILLLVLLIACVFKKRRNDNQESVNIRAPSVKKTSSLGNAETDSEKKISAVYATVIPKSKRVKLEVVSSESEQKDRPGSLSLYASVDDTDHNPYNSTQVPESRDHQGEYSAAIRVGGITSDNESTDFKNDYAKLGEVIRSHENVYNTFSNEVKTTDQHVDVHNDFFSLHTDKLGYRSSSNLIHSYNNVGVRTSSSDL